LNLAEQAFKNKKSAIHQGGQRF